MLGRTIVTFLTCILPALACPGHVRRGANGTATPQTYEVQTRIKPSAPTGNVAITNVRVWDGYKVNEPSTVFVSGDLISGPKMDVAQIIDGQNSILLPGLIDAHAHPD
jgi:adenine deaminase